MKAVLPSVSCLLVVAAGGCRDHHGARGLIVLNRAIGGVSLGEPRKLVERRLGPGTPRGRESVVYEGLVVIYLRSRVVEIETRSSRFRTRRGLGVGSSIGTVIVRTPGAECGAYLAGGRAWTRRGQCHLGFERLPNLAGTVFLTGTGDSPVRSVIVARGAVTRWGKEFPRPRTVPRIVGLTVATAARRVADRGLCLRLQLAPRGRKGRKGRIVSQAARPGARVYGRFTLTARLGEGLPRRSVGTIPETNVFYPRPQAPGCKR